MNNPVQINRGDNFTDYLSLIEMALSPERRNEDIQQSFEILQYVQDCLMFHGIDCMWTMAATKEKLIRDWQSKNKSPK